MMLSLHSHQDPKKLSDTVMVHGVETTYEQAVADGLMLVNLDADGFISHVEIINPATPGFVSPDGALPGYEGTIVKQSQG